MDTTPMGNWAAGSISGALVRSGTALRFRYPPHDGSTKEGRIYSRPLGRHPQSGFSPADMEKPSVERVPKRGRTRTIFPSSGKSDTPAPEQDKPTWLSAPVVVPRQDRRGGRTGRDLSLQPNSLAVSSFRRNQSAGVTHLPAFAATPPSRGCARLSYGQARWRIHIPRSPFIRAHKVDNSNSS